MKKSTLILIVAISVVRIALGQTKAETEQWINSKMQKTANRTVSDDNSLGPSSGDFQTTLKTFYLKDGMLSYSYLLYNTAIGHLTGSSVVRGENIPIKYLKNVSTASSHSQKYYSLDLEFDNYFDVDVISNTDSKEDTIRFRIPNIEENLGERLVKAFKHYKSFYPTSKKSKETF